MNSNKIQIKDEMQITSNRTCCTFDEACAKFSEELKYYAMCFSSDDGNFKLTLEFRPYEVDFD